MYHMRREDRKGSEFFCNKKYTRSLTHVQTFNFIIIIILVQYCSVQRKDRVAGEVESRRLTSVGDWRAWRMTAELQSTVSAVLELAVHLERGAEVAACHAATVAKNTTLHTHTHTHKHIRGEPELYRSSLDMSAT